MFTNERGEKLTLLEYQSRMADMAMLWYDYSGGITENFILYAEAWRELERLRKVK